MHTHLKSNFDKTADKTESEDTEKKKARAGNVRPFVRAAAVPDDTINLDPHLPPPPYYVYTPRYILCV